MVVNEVLVVRTTNLERWKDTMATKLAIAMVVQPLPSVVTSGRKGPVRFFEPKSHDLLFKSLTIRNIRNKISQRFETKI